VSARAAAHAEGRDRGVRGTVCRVSRWDQERPSRRPVTHRSESLFREEGESPSGAARKRYDAFRELTRRECSYEETWESRSRSDASRVVAPRDRKVVRDKLRRWSRSSLPSVLTHVGVAPRRERCAGFGIAFNPEGNLQLQQPGNRLLQTRRKTSRSHCLAVSARGGERAV